MVTSDFTILPLMEVSVKSWEGHAQFGTTTKAEASAKREVAAAQNSLKDGAGGRDRTGMGLFSPRDFKLNPDTETIESYLHESEEYHNDWGSED